jgi:hypothetical protein
MGVVGSRSSVGFPISNLGGVGALGTVKMASLCGKSGKDFFSCIYIYIYIYILFIFKKESLTSLRPHTLQQESKISKKDNFLVFLSHATQSQRPHAPINAPKSKDSPTAPTTNSIFLSPIEPASVFIQFLPSKRNVKISLEV